MDQKKIWLEAFKKSNRRNPTIEEVSQAAKMGFALPNEETSVTSQSSETVVSPESPATAWREKFKLENGRLPSIDEVRDAKHNGFKNTTPLAGQTVVKTPKKTMPKGKKIILTVVVVGVVSIIGVFIWGNQYYSQGATAKRTLAILKSQNATQYANHFIWADSKKAISKDSVKPFVNQMAKLSWSQGDEATTYNQLINQKDTDGYVFKQNGRKFLLFPNYQLQITPVDLKLTTNNKGITLKVNGNEVGVSDSDSYTKKITHQASGLYKFTASGKVSGQDVSASDSRTINQNDNVNLSIDMISFDVNSNLKSGDLYVGGTKIGTLNDGLLKVNKVPISKGAKAYVEADFGGHTIRSSKTNLNDLYDGESINLDADGLMTQSDASSTLSSMYNALGSYASSKTDSNDMSMFKDGANNKSYQDYKQMIKHNLNDAKRHAESVTFNTPDVQSVTQTGLNTADATYQVKTDFYYSSDTDPDGHSYGDLTQTYQLIAHMIYDKRSKSWQIDSIDGNQKKISEDNNVK
ncbi:zinc ribbon domain-containing protein [Leuconostoc citreum]|uniref:zinc ribbon domain-containing protein n=1 Tax=Leuconostoc citreum TaxID=33964 RepID=UPI000C2903C8|nr:hypothetical protein [Leuconostoc citreum]